MKHTLVTALATTALVTGICAPAATQTTIRLSTYVNEAAIPL